MPKVDKTPELVGAADTDSPPSPSVPLAANVALKLPVFQPDAAEVWFAQADAQLVIKTITVSKTKFYHAVASLPQDVAAQILGLISAPPAGDPYEILKERLTTLYSLKNDYQRFEALVSLPLTGDQKPSHLMNRILVLLQDNYRTNSSFEVCSSVVFLSRFVCTCCRRRSWILMLWRSRQMNSSRAEFLLQRICQLSKLRELKLTLWLPESVLLRHLGVLLHLLHPCILHLIQVHVGISRNMDTKLSTVGNPAWSRKTSSLAGGAFLPTCRFLQAVI